MSMSRSQYGRYCERTVTITYSADIGGSLCALLSNLKSESGLKVVNSKTLPLLNDTIMEFYSRALELLLSPSQLETEDSDSKESDQDQNQTNRQSKETDVFLPKSMLLLFCFLFDIEIYAEEAVGYADSAFMSKRDRSWFMRESKYEEILAEYKEFIRFIEETILEKKAIFLTLKIALFLKSMRVLLENNLLKANPPYDKRISDFMKSELASVYMNPPQKGTVQRGLSERIATTFSAGSQGSSPSGSLNESKNSSGGGVEQPPTITASLNDSLLACFSIFARINSLVLKHLSNEELEVFVFQPCFGGL